MLLVARRALSALGRVAGQSIQYSVQPLPLTVLIKRGWPQTSSGPGRLRLAPGEVSAERNDLVQGWPLFGQEPGTRFLPSSWEGQKWREPAEGQLATQAEANTPPYTRDSLQESRLPPYLSGSQAQLLPSHLGKPSPLEEPWLRVSWPSRGRGSVLTVLLPPKLNWSLGAAHQGPFFKGSAGGGATVGRPGQARRVGCWEANGSFGQGGVGPIPTGSCPLPQPEVPGSLSPAAAPTPPQALPVALLGDPGGCRRRWSRKC